MHHHVTRSGSARSRAKAVIRVSHPARNRACVGGALDDPPDARRPHLNQLRMDDGDAALG